MMRMVPVLVGVLVVLAWSGGCSDPRKDSIPTEMRSPPKEKPSVQGGYAK